VWNEITTRLDAGTRVGIKTTRKVLAFYQERAMLLAQAGLAEDDAGLATRTGRISDRAASLLANHPYHRA